MEQNGIYRVSVLIIGVLITFGLILCLICILALLQGGSFSFIIGLIVPFTFIGYGIYLWKKRKQGQGFYWDDEGVVIDLNGKMVYWNEIETIKFINARGMKSTVIYPYYTNHEKIRIRRKKWMPTIAYSINWVLIEKPKEYHESLMKAWKEKNNTQK